MTNDAVPARQVTVTAWICFLIAALEGYDIQSLGVASPWIIGELGLSPQSLGLAGSAAMVGLVIGAIIGGWAAERRGPKPVLVWATALFAACSLLTAYAHSFESLLAARLFTGIGFGGAMPNLLAVATRLRPGGRHAGMATAIFCGMPVGGAGVAFIAQSLGNAEHWRMLFVIGGVLPLLLVPVAWRWMPDLSPVRRAGPGTGTGNALFGEGRLAATLLIWLGFALALMLLYLLLNWLPLLVIGKGQPPALGSRAAFCFNLAAIPGALLLGQLADRRGYRMPIAIATAILLAGLAGLIAADGAAAILISAALLGAASIGMQYVLYAAVPLLYPAETRIAAAGVAIGVGRLGSIGGPMLAGWLRQGGYDVNTLLAMLVPIALVAGGASIAAIRR